MSIGNRRWLAEVVCVLTAVAVATPVIAQSKDEKKRQKEVQEAMQREARPVLLLINELQKQQGDGQPQAYMVNPKEGDPAKAIASTSPAVDPTAFQWQHDMMKAADGKVYVPYTMFFPPDAVGSGPVSVYLRVVPRGAQPPAGEQKADEARFPFEDFYSVEPRAVAGQSARVMRAFAAAPGAYDIYVGIRPKPADPKKTKDDPVRVVALKKTLDLPNYWDGQLTTSTVVVTSKVETVEGKVSPEAQRERPYLFGQTEFIPAFDSKFKKADELSVVFQIYNPSLEAGKPNVSIEYSFHQKLAEGEKYFNKTNPQQLNAQTLPPTFDVAATQMLPGGQSVPLASFPAGDYRMEIKITDHVAKKTITRDVPFTVLAS